MTLANKVNEFIRYVDREVVWGVSNGEQSSTAKCTINRIQVEVYWDEYGHDLWIDGIEIRHDYECNTKELAHFLNDRLNVHP